MEEEQWYWKALWLNIILAFSTAASLTRITAPYGRHTQAAPSSSLDVWGPSMPARDGWVLMESPALWFTLLVFSAGKHSSETVPLVLLRLFQLHYTHRALIYPFRMRSRGKTISIAIVALSFVFNIYNGYLQARWLSEFGTYPDTWLRSPQFISGSLLFAAGMVTNVWADSVLISLRKPGEERGGYKLPQGWLFSLVACPNYSGEILEWLGWALLTWSPAGLVFFIFTAANLIPRAVAHRRWYVSKFPEFPASRRAVIPFVL
ncbi:hypothetical protein SELMODRAFT_132835 [Selaginella moellendorffii]|uniref:Steroid 5-alpha-reductase DET2 n=1 Tax=Selaginella moellendorffii TaxID=88036 RepID=D8T630_SELML|nr:steroid 5-alpha-reductase DET2 [Selaginella moellendorffii]EFJ07904.1 hypothetical protein SELMODRAFT_132835 [Selaginella moellendorffii]|eukprot:XP_002991096.1 steroid 5-alpha-reductase DET2 [Selaginella moellendorffii]